MLIALLPLVAAGLAWRSGWINATTSSSTRRGLMLLPRPRPVAEP